VRINLLEDRPPVNITSPGPVPINLCIGRMHLERDKNGLLQIQPIGKYFTIHKLIWKISKILLLLLQIPI